MFADRRLATSLFFSMLVASTVLAARAEAASVSVGQTLAPGWANGFCSACTISAQPSRYFASFTLDEAMTLTDASFAIREIPAFNVVTHSFSVSIWDQPLQGSALFEQGYVPGGYATQGLGTGSPASGFLSVDLSDWTLGPGTYWLSIFATPGKSLMWGGDGAVGGDKGFIINSSTGAVTENPNVHLGFQLTGDTFSTVPVPGTLGLLAMGLAVMATTLRARR